MLFPFLHLLLDEEILQLYQSLLVVAL